VKPISFSLLSAGLLLPASGLAAIIGQDSFSAYTIGAELPGQNPTIAGYVGPWTDVAFGNAEPAVIAGSLTYSGANYAPGGGEKVGKGADTATIGAANSGRVERLLDTALVASAATSGTVYLSWLFRTGNENLAASPNVYQTLALWNGTGATDGLRDFEAGIASGDFATANYGFRVDNNAPANLNVAADANVHLFVAKFVLSSAALSDSVTVWIDPVLGAGEPTGGVTISGKDIAFDRLVLSDYASNSSEWDDIRWGSSFDSVTTETVLPSIPAFEAQPVDYIGSVGDNVVLQAGAISAPAPEYQWQKSVDGVNGWADIDGATANTLELVFASYADNGFYRVIATNANGSVTSEVAQVDLIYPAPQIVTQPAPVAAEEGTTVVLTVAATGLGNLTYQWFKDFVELPGETLDALTITDIDAGDVGDYSVEITDDAAEADGQPATVISSATALVTVFEPWNGLVSHDAFDTTADYAPGPLVDQNPAIAGYQNPWALTNGFGPISPVVAAGSLAYPNALYLGSSGGSVNTPADAETINATNAGRVGRLLEPRLVVNNATTGTRYVSWLFRSGFENGAPSPQVYQTLAFFNGALGTDANRDFEAGIAVGAADFNTTNFAFRVNNSAGMIGNLGVPSDGNVHLFVAKFELSDQAGGDSVTVWIDPGLGSADPAGGVTVTGADLLWDRIALSDYASDSSHWDEIRWGSTFNSVTLNPNPPANFAAWIGGFNVGSLNGFDDDADGDGIKNGLENVFGTDPSVPNQGVTAVARTGNTVTFRHPQSGVQAGDVTASYRWSTDLATFHASGATVGGTSVTLSPALNTPSAGTTTVTATLTGTPAPRLFLVLEAIHNTP
jgi:hypothetical protein